MNQYAVFLQACDTAHLPAKTRFKPSENPGGRVPEQFRFILFRNVCMQKLSEIELTMQLPVDLIGVVFAR